MANDAIYFDIDAKTKQKFKLKCLMNQTTQKQVLEQFVREYVYGKKKAKTIQITPILTRGFKGAKAAKKF